MDEQTKEEISVSSEISKENTPQTKNGNIMVSKKNLAILAIFIAVIVSIYFSKGLFIAATVNGSPISRIAVIQALEKSSGKQALNALITKKVISDEVRKRGITVTDEEINAGIKYISDQITAQGSTLEEALAAQGVTMADFRNNQRTQIEVEKLLADKIVVTDAEVNQYILEKKINIPQDQLALAKIQIHDQLKREKLNKEGQILVDSLRSAAKISYFVDYAK